MDNTKTYQSIFDSGSYPLHQRKWDARSQSLNEHIVTLVASVSFRNSGGIICTNRTHVNCESFDWHRLVPVRKNVRQCNIQSLCLFDVTSHDNDTTCHYDQAIHQTVCPRR